MKKSFFYSITSTFVMFSFAFVSCKMQNLLCYSPDENNSSIITSKLGEFKKTGLLDSFYNNYARASVNEFEVENSDIQYFIDNSDECIAEILKEPDGNKSLAVLNAIYSESTVGDIYNAMNNLSSDLANEYESSIDKNYCEFGSVLEAIKGCIDCYNRNTDFFAKTTSIGASTAAVGVVAFCTGFCALVKGWISSISSLIPEWLTINGSGFVLSFCW